MKTLYKLPNGKYTYSVKEFAKEWNAYGEDVRKHGLIPLGYDPGILIGIPNSPITFNIPVVAYNLLTGFRRKEMNELPDDWEYPRWDETEKVMDWKNHVSAMLQQIWNTFTRSQKQIIAIGANEEAYKEEWD